MKLAASVEFLPRPLPSFSTEVQARPLALRFPMFSVRPQNDVSDPMLVSTYHHVEAAWASTAWVEDAYEAPAPSEALRLEAKAFVLRLARVSFTRFSRLIPVPTFTPTADGSIDIHWGDGEERELLLGLSRSGGVASFFGRCSDSGSQIKGVLQTTEVNEFLAAWLLEQHEG